MVAHQIEPMSGPGMLRPSESASLSTPEAAPACDAGRNPQDDLDGQWRNAGLVLGIGLAGLLAMFWGTAWSLGHIWWKDSSFGHGFLIVPICAYLIWLRIDRVRQLTPRPSALGALLIAPAALAWLAGNAAGVQLVEQVALVAMIQGVVLAALGSSVAKAVAFPLFYLYFAVPVGSFLIGPLQDLTADIVVRVLHLIGIPVYLDGIFLYIPSGTFEVAEACAGLRFLITSIALGVVFANVFYKDTWRRVMFIALSVIVPIFANGLRASIIVLLAHYSDYQIAAGADHITYGLVFLGLVLASLFALGYAFREPDHGLTPIVAPAAREAAAASAPASLRSPAARLIVAVAGVLAIAGAARAYAAHVGAAESGEAMTFAVLDPAGPWQPSDPAHPDWRPKFLNADLELLQGYAANGRRVDLYVAYYRRQTQGAEVVNGLNSLVGPNPWQRAGSGTVTAALRGQALDAAYVRIVTPRRQRMVWYWYWIDGRLTASPMVAKIYEVGAKLLGGRRDAAVVALATDMVEDPADAQRVLSEYLAQAGVVEALFPARGPGSVGRP